MTRVAALYVDPNGVYAGLPDVDVWDEARDARLYDGPYPVVAHPPCRVWSLMGNCRPEIPKDDDGGLFEHALWCVREFGGVLEHPAYTRAWRRYGLQRPEGAGWTRPLFGDEGWTCSVDQRHYGHRCNRPTWLYYVGPDPPRLAWGRGPRGRIPLNNSHHGDGTDRSGTPPAFRDVLLSMARSASRELTGAAWVS